jgi:hypothetical protein
VIVLLAVSVIKDFPPLSRKHGFVDTLHTKEKCNKHAV